MQRRNAESDKIQNIKSKINMSAIMGCKKTKPLRNQDLSENIKTECKAFKQNSSGTTTKKFLFFRQLLHYICCLSA